ncbi:MAG: N-formylglutamate amidohydrolase [Kangiellaceae bacterium]|nr:N-formylglutamate amidohydrolase [Kangiellaceae bacterium]
MSEINKEKIQQLVEKFEESQFEGSDFFHLEHLLIAWHYVCHQPLAVAKQKFHQGVLELVTKLGVREKYHRTLTDFFLDYLAHLHWYLGTGEWQAVETNCPLIINNAKKLVGFYYSDELLQSDEARLGFVEADRMVLDRASLKLTVEEAPVFELEEFESPLIVSIPHNGQFIPHDVLKTMLPTALDSADTDWYLSQLYAFTSDLNVTRLSSNYSRYLIDLNRDSSGKVLYANADNTELCPTSTFDLEPLYDEDEQPDATEIKRRTELYWKPYHHQLQRLIDKAKAQFGYAIVFEAHSIAQEVPRFFDGKLPDFNFGTNDGQTVNESLAKLIEDFDTSDYSKVINARFKGGFITRHYAKPEDNVFTIQLELSQANYLDMSKNLMNLVLADKLKVKLRHLLELLKGYSIES